jgi:hypothetical protein
VKQQMGPRAFFRHCKENLPFMMTELPYMPKLLNEVLTLSKQHYQISLHENRLIEHESHYQQWWIYVGFAVICVSGGVLVSHWTPSFAEKNIVFSFLSGAGLVSILGLMFSKKINV